MIANPDAPRSLVKLRGAFGYNYSRFSDVLQGDTGVSDPFERSMELHLFLLSLSATFDVGTGLSVALPLGVLQAEAGAVKSSVEGLGDMEVRATQDFGVLLRGTLRRPPILRIGVGLALPTGETGAPTAVAGDETAVAFTGTGAPGDVTSIYAALGRGATWLLADAEIVWPVVSWSAVIAAVRTRTAVDEGSNHIRWGADVRSSLGATFMVAQELLHMGLTFDHQWRGQNEELHGADYELILNSGGHWVTVTPSVTATPVPGFELGVSARVPVYRNVEGVQLVEGFNMMVSIGYGGGVGEVPGVPRQPDREHVRSGDVTVAIDGGRAFALEDILAPGRVTLVDWYADWCVPCKKLDRQLRVFSADRPDVAVRKVDIVDWETPAAGLLSGVAGLPVLDVHGPDGGLIIRLVGDEVFTFPAHVPPPGTDREPPGADQPPDVAPGSEGAPDLLP